MQLKINHIDSMRLYTMERFTDPEAGTLIRITPNDPKLDIRWRGEVVVNIPNGQSLTVSFDINGASSLETAINLWPKECEAAVKEALEQMRSQAIRSAIITSHGGKPQ